MNDIKVFSNSDLKLQVRTIQNEDGSVSVNVEDAAKGFGWTQTQNKNGKQYTSTRWETINDYCTEFGFPNKLGKDDYIPESLFYMLGMKANNKVAQDFQKWLAIDVIPSIRKTGSYHQPKPVCIEDVLIQSLQEMKDVKQRLEQQDQAIADTNTKLESIKEVVALNPNSWRKETSNFINKMALKMGGYEHIKAIREESYKTLDERYGVALSIRLTNKKKTMALNGVCKSKVDKLNQLDVIADDKKLIEGYVNIIKQMAIKYGVA
jgi:prophage antirepressor-like protein